MKNINVKKNQKNKQKKRFLHLISYTFVNNVPSTFIP